jgi:DNA-binding response OmpR family regulator
MIHNILIGDANRSVLTFHEGLLRQAGYKVALAHDMRAVSTQLRLASFSLVIAELALPDAGPADAVNLIRRVTALRPGTPILVLTSNTDPEAHRLARRLGVWDIIAKPTHCAELLSLTKNILDAAYPERSGCLGRFMADAATEEIVVSVRDHSHGLATFAIGEGPPSRSFIRASIS